jgi:hypothetical protein
MRALLDTAKSLARGIRLVLREIADENAYERHLAAEHRAHSPEEWRRFLDKRLACKFARAKCC